MTGSRGRRRVSSRLGMIAALIAGPAIGLGALATADDKAKGKPVVRPVATTVAKKPPAAPQPPKPPDRPAKTVTPPTLTSDALDAMIDKYVEANKAPLASATSDVEFIRRVCLDLTGKPPTVEEVTFFNSISGRSKRAKVIEYLLSTPDFAKNWARYWRDVIKYRETVGTVLTDRSNELEDWLTEQIAKNTPWDEVAKGLISATGREDVNGAVAFTLLHDNRPAEMAGEVSRIFLGVQIQCAECHDHPNDSWKRQQFHEFAAFFAGISRKNLIKNRAIDEVSISNKPTGYGMPDKQDPQKRIPVSPKFFLDPKGESLANGLTAQQRVATGISYVTGQDNPWFAKAYVNRVWYTLMGSGFYNPVDDMGPERTAKAPEILDALASQWAQGGYDARWLFRTILNTRAYQREVRSTYSAAGRIPFASNCSSRLRSDQILDTLGSVLNISFKDPVVDKSMPPATDVESLDKARNKRRNGTRDRFNDTFGLDPSTPYEEILGTIPQALFLMNNGQLYGAMQGGGNGVLAQILKTYPNNLAALNALYLRVLSRPPTAGEIRMCGLHVERSKNRQEAFEDILWCLVNSTEFVTRR